MEEEKGPNIESKKRKAEESANGDDDSQDMKKSRTEQDSAPSSQATDEKDKDHAVEDQKKGEQLVEESTKLSEVNGDGEEKKAPEDTPQAETEAAKEQTGESLPQEEKKEDDSKEASKEPPQEKMNAYDALHYCIIENDGTHDSLVKLVGLKSLFAKQLPKMPRAYIARLVFDRRHKSLAILSDDPAHKGGDEEIIGAICYRGFAEMRFAEIAFCAVNSSHQVKGYGTKLMNLVKRHAVTEGIEYLITYADNYAIGYFKKQGFSKSIAMPKGRYKGLIKDYDGGTMMECYVHPSIDYTRIPEMLEAQRNFILDRVKIKSKSDKVVYDALPKGWQPTREGISRANAEAALGMAIPGVAEAGWTMADLMAATGGAKDDDKQKNALKSELLQLVRKTEEQQVAWPFRQPVDTTEVPDYLTVVKEPIDLSTIDKRIRKGDWYRSKQMLYRDLMLMVNNCKLYNDDSSPYHECAETLAQFLKTIFPDVAA